MALKQRSAQQLLDGSQSWETWVEGKGMEEVLKKRRRSGRRGCVAREEEEEERKRKEGSSSLMERERGRRQQAQHSTTTLLPLRYGYPPPLPSPYHHPSPQTRLQLTLRPRASLCECRRAGRQTTRHGTWERRTLTGPFSDPSKRTQPTGNVCLLRFSGCRPGPVVGQRTGFAGIILARSRYCSYNSSTHTMLVWQAGMARFRSMHMAAMPSNRRGAHVSRACGMLML